MRKGKSWRNDDARAAFHRFHHGGRVLPHDIAGVFQQSASETYGLAPILYTSVKLNSSWCEELSQSGQPVSPSSSNYRQPSDDRSY